MCELLIATILSATASFAAPTAAAPRRPAARCEASILVYHRFGASVTDGMTVRTTTFRSQLQYLKQHDHPVIPLRSVVSCLQGHSKVPPGAVVLTADDGHVSVFTEMLPIVRDYNVPVTLFIYPSAISNASYAMTWQQLDALRRTGLFDIESHTYWHPNFKTEKRRLAPGAYRSFATSQLIGSKTTLRKRLGVEPDLLAWPFGIYDDELIALAVDAGYRAGFTLGRRSVTDDVRIMAIPRFLVMDTDTGRAFASMLRDPKQ